MLHPVMLKLVEMASIIDEAGVDSYCLFLLISQEKLKLSRSAQPGCNVQASVPYSLLGRLKFNLE